MEVILTHEHADFDATASQLAASKLFPGAVPVLPHNLNRNVRDFLVLYRSSLPFRRADELPRTPIEQVVLVDTQQVQAIRGMTPGTLVRIVDHHPRERDLPSQHHYWGESVGATTTLLLEQIIARGLTLTPIEATLLILGIYEDTGGMVYASTTARDLRCAAWLLERGANLEVVNDFLHHPLTPAQQRLLRQLQERAETFDIAGHTIIIATAAVDEQVDEISTLAHKLRDFFDPDGLFLIVDLRDRIQLVARSTTSLIHVGAIAEVLGGGGHARAAAALIRQQPLAAVRSHLLDILHQKVHPPITVRQIMSWGVNTLEPETTVMEASQRMRRLGYEGFPVVENDQLLGLMTRRELDRAMQHKMGKVPVRRVMRAGTFTVGIDESVQTLQKRMMESGWGQMPVVDRTGVMVGIVTRTDLLKLWAAPEAALAPMSAALKMQATLPEGLLLLLRQVGEAAQQLNNPLYTVGGFVRDLLLGYPNFDVDLVVEGDASTLAHKLAALYGGRVRSHRRFGTAKWIRDDAAFAAGLPLSDDTPSSLDFATARTEFYEEPTALPVVESSNVKLDLHRRDFTINTLAVRLDPPHWGELLDFYGGERDLEEGVIRVLHSLSFVEDPTRILRAARFEQRFGFRIEPRSAELIAESVDLLARLSGGRIRHEFDLLFLEREPENVLRRLQELGVLAILHPDLRWSDDLAPKFKNLRLALTELPAPPASTDRLYAALWLRRHPAGVQRHFLGRLHVTSATHELIEEGIRLVALEPDLSVPDLLASQLDALLAPFSDAALLVARIGADDWVISKRIHHYQVHLRPQRIHLGGDHLRALGLRPGPEYRDILQAVRAAVIDGRIGTAAEEEELARRLMATPKEVNTT